MYRYLVFGVVGITLLFQTMNTTAIAVAFPVITSSFQVSITLAGWVLTIFQLALIVTVPLSGKASDALGRKRTFMFFVAVFTVGSFLCSIAPNIYWLILFRVIQGAGIGGFLTCATGIVADAFPESRQRSIGLISSVLAMGSVIGPNVGGWLTESFGWRSTFWFNVPLGIAVLLVGAILLKKDGKMGKFNFDAKGATLLTASLGAFMAGLTSLGKGTGMSWAAALTLAFLGFVLMLVFVRHEGSVNNPMVDLELLKGRPFVAANVFNVFFGFLMGVFTFLPLYSVTVYKVSTLESGLLVTPRTVGIFLASVVSSFLLVRWGYRRPMVLGTVMMILASAYFGLESLWFDSNGVALGGIVVMSAIVALAGLGQGVVLPAANNACIELMPDRLSTITGLRQAARNIGLAIGLAAASIGLTVFGSLTRGFIAVFFGMSLIGIAIIPWIFRMPSSPSDRRAASPRANGSSY